MRRLAAALALLLGPGAHAFAGTGREIGLRLPGLSAPAPGLAQPATRMGTGAALPEIPRLPASDVHAPRGLNARAADARAVPPTGLAAAAPAERVAAQAIGKDADPRAASAAAFDGFIPRGFELEYAPVSSPADSSIILPAQIYGAALQAAAPLMGLGAPTYAQDHKYKSGHHKATAVDDAGREWKSVPEEVNGVKYDGVELVAPPLVSRREVEKLSLVHDGVLAGAVLVRGMSSSMHVTYDVLHLIDDDGGAARLVDAILLIENNWLKIYGAASPARYGTIVNRFSVPLGADHPALLQELAGMPRAERTMKNVRALFERFDAAETALWGGHPGKSWKMRAANYGKLFGVQAGYQEKPLPVIEFRVADLPESGVLTKISDLFAALLTRAPPQNAFTPSLAPGRSFRDFNLAVARQDPAAYRAFLAERGLEPSDYPLLGRLALKNDPDVEDVARAALAAAAKSALGLELAFEPGESSKDALIALASASPHPKARRLAAAAIQGQDQPTMRALGEAFLQDAHPSVREAALEQLLENASEPVWNVLYHAAQDVSENARYHVVAALVARNDPMAAPVIRLLISDPNEMIRSWAWYALQTHTTQETVDVLLALMDPAQPGDVPAVAFASLEGRVDPAALAARRTIYRAKPWWKRAWLRLLRRAPPRA